MGADNVRKETRYCPICGVRLQREYYYTGRCANHQGVRLAPDGVGQLTADAVAARAWGVTYGQYMAMKKEGVEMAHNINKTVEKRARPCVCGRHPVWTKFRTSFMVACPNVGCPLYLAIRRSSLEAAIDSWNAEVTDYDALRKGH